jgi:hypothetical protein
MVWADTCVSRDGGDSSLGSRRRILLAATEADWARRAVDQIKIQVSLVPQQWVQKVGRFPVPLQDD